jgi:hypothetical protein
MLHEEPSQHNAGAQDLKADYSVSDQALCTLQRNLLAFQSRTAHWPLYVI